MAAQTKKSRNYTIFSILMIVILSLLTACGAKSTVAPAASEAPAAATAAPTNSSEAANKVITIGTTGGFYPYVFKNTADNKLEGYEVDIWEAVGEKIGYQIDWKTAEFAGLFGLLEAGKIDTIANSIAVTDARKGKYYFAEPYVYSGAQLVVKKGNDSIKTLADLKGKKIAVQSGTNFANLVKEADKENQITVVNYESADGEFNDVALGRVDATFATRANALAQIKKTGLPLQLAGDQLTVIPAANPFVKNDTNKAFVEKVNKALETLRNDGTLAKISVKWFTEDLSKP